MKTYALMTAGLALALTASMAEAKGPKGGSMASYSGSGSPKATMSAGKPGGFSTGVNSLGGNKSVGSVAKNHNGYHMQHGTKFGQGYFYKGKQHTHWSSRSYNKQYGCWTYYCPSTCCSYYWCEPASCYYPVSYCPYQTYGSLVFWPVSRMVGRRKLKG